MDQYLGTHDMLEADDDDDDDDISTLSSLSSSSSSSSDDSDDEMELDREMVPTTTSQVNPFRLPILNTILLLTSWSMQVDILIQELSLQREVRRPYMRKDWNEYWTLTMNDPSFEREIRMKCTSFIKLISFLEPMIRVDEDMANRRGGPISPALCLYITIRYLTGDSYQMMANIAGISPTSFYSCLKKTLKAICCCPQLAIVFPSTYAECDALAEGFENVSEKWAIVNCVGCVDGYLLAITEPALADDDNTRSYFSGHYQKPGINVQAVCDRNAMFTYFALSAPGSANDRVAIKELIGGESLSDKIEQLPGDFVVLADAGYEATEKLIPMFYGHQRNSPLNSNFNYAASSIRMRIEMDFGQMVSKFGILQRPLKNNLSSVKFIALAIARLHNFCVKERTFGESQWERDNNQPFQYLRSVPNLLNMDERFPATHEGENRYMYLNTGESTIRNKMAYVVRNRGLQRPVRSVLHPAHMP
jgi:DDE superfamily endonuclease